VPVFQRLTYNIGLNPFGTVKAIACAIADKDGELTLFVDPNNRGESSVKIVSGDRGAGNVRVPAKRLMSILVEEGFEHLDAAKLDVEGAEDLILDTFFKEAPVKLWPRLLIIERGNSRWSIDIPALLAKQGYRVIATTKNNQIYERD
jgi:FkbM family methyltransferase